MTLIVNWTNLYKDSSGGARPGADGRDWKYVDSSADWRRPARRGRQTPVRGPLQERTKPVRFPGSASVFACRFCPKLRAKCTDQLQPARPLSLYAGFAQKCERNAPANCRPARPLSLRVRFVQNCGGEPRAGSRPGVPCFFIPVFSQNCRTLLVGNCDFDGSRRRFVFRPKRLLVGNFPFVFFSGRVCIPILSFLTEIAGALWPADLRTSA